MKGWRLVVAHLSGRRCRSVAPGRGRVRCRLRAGHELAGPPSWAHEGPDGFGYRWWK